VTLARWDAAGVTADGLILALEAYQRAQDELVESGTCSLGRSRAGRGASSTILEGEMAMTNEKAAHSTNMESRALITPQLVTIDGAMTAAVAVITGLLTATFVDNGWKIQGDGILPLVVVLIGAIGVVQRIVQKRLDRQLAPSGEADDERMKRLLREVLDERPDEV
jgi:hypothetical protein